MSCVDMMGLGIPVLAPAAGAFLELVPASLLFESLGQAEKMTERLLEDDLDWADASRKALASAHALTGARFRGVFAECVRALT